MSGTPRAVWVVAALVGAIGCGSSSSTSTIPNPIASAPVPAGTVVSIAVTSSGPTIFLGAPEVFTAVATYSSGGSQSVTNGVWGTDTPLVAVVDASSGKVTGVGNGNVNVYVDFQGVRGSKAIRVLPNYAGVWNGTYVVTSCTQTDGFAADNVCSNFGVGQALPLYFQFTQTVDALSGFTAIGLLESTNFGATVNLDGTVTISVQVFVSTVEIDITWNLTCVTAGTIGGTVTETWQDTATPGQMVVVGSLQNVTPQSVSRTQRLGTPPVRSLADVVAASRR